MIVASFVPVEFPEVGGHVGYIRRALEKGLFGTPWVCMLYQQYV